MRGDDEAPVAELGISFFGPNTLVMNDAGLVVFHAFLNGGAGGRSIWSDESGTLSLIAREGDPAPGIDGANYSFLLSNPGVNNAGQIAFKANTKIGGAFGPQGIWLHDPGVLGDPELIVESGDPASGTSKTFSGCFDVSGTIEDVAQGAVFLASPIATYITGTTLMIDGGSNLPGSGMMGKMLTEALSQG